MTMEYGHTQWTMLLHTQQVKHIQLFISVFPLVVFLTGSAGLVSQMSEAVGTAYIGICGEGVISISSTYN